MRDAFQREINYLRVSVTELCNLRCRYCMPADGVCKKTHSEMLSAEETLIAVRAAAALGFRKLRLTGGEPLVKRNIVDLCAQIAEVEGIEEICMTTNGVLLPKLGRSLRDAGVNRLNISLDTLDPKKYAYITRVGRLEDAIAGLEAGLEAGFDKIKINAVLIGGFNDDEIVPLAELTKKYPVDMRFIELMPMYDSGDFSQWSMIPVTRVLETLPELERVKPDGGVASLYRLPGAMGNVGLISPVSAHFCGTCNRLRLTADGKIKSCLHSSEEFSVKGMSLEEMMEQFRRAILSKPECHEVLTAKQRSKAGRNMNEIGG